MVKILSIQTGGMGHRTYCETMREYFSGFEDVSLTSYWSRQRRSLPTKIITRIAETRLPVLNRSWTELDFGRARAEWAHGRMSCILAKRLLREKKYDLLHFHTQVQALRAAKLMRTIPSVISIDMTAYQVAEEPTVQYPFTYQPIIAMEKKTLDRAAHIVTWSEWARSSVIRDHGIAANRVTVIPPGIRLHTFTTPDFNRRAVPRLLFVGSDFSRKGGWDVLKVFREHFSDRAELHIVSGYDFGAVGKNIFVHRGVSAYTPAWHQIFRQSDIFVLPTYAEAYGQVFQEAAGYGLAIIGSKINAIPEMVRDGWNGLLVTPGDREDLRAKLAVLLEEPDNLLLMRSNSRKIAEEEFDGAKNFLKLAHLFKEVAYSGT